MNIELFTSSVIVSFILFSIFILYYDTTLQILYLVTFISMVTSIFNHGMTNKIIQYIDRLTIMLTAVVYCVYVYSLETIWMLISVCYILLASSLYFLTKLSDQSIYHMIAHCIVIPLFFIIHVYRPQNKINYF